MNTMNNYRQFKVLVAQLALSTIFLAGCGRSVDNAAPAAANAAASAPAKAVSGPVVPVTTVRAQQQDFAVVLQAIGTVVPISSIDVKAQVTSVVTQVHVTEGQFVRAGELLFMLDSRSDQANVAKMRAQMAKDAAALADARRQLARSRELLTQNFVSKGAVDAAQATADAQAAAVDGDRAALDAAQVALSYARVVAPGSGRVGAIPVYAGTAVQANQTTLVTITQLDPIDVSFSLPQRHLANLLAALKDASTPVSAALPEGGGALSGQLQFVDNAIDTATGTVKVKARFANQGNRLWPGAFVNVSMNAGMLKDAVVIPLASVIQSARGPIVYVVDNGKAALRPVKVLESRGEDAAVSGVRVGDRVVLDGRQNLRPDSAVTEHAREEPGKAASAAGRADKVAS